jgi:hypothetical protein
VAPVVRGIVNEPAQLNLFEAVEDDHEPEDWEAWFRSLPKVPPPVGLGPQDPPVEEAA